MKKKTKNVRVQEHIEDREDALAKLEKVPKLEGYLSHEKTDLIILKAQLAAFQDAEKELKKYRVK